MAYSVAPNSQIPRTVRIPITGVPYYRYGYVAVQRDMNVINFYYDKVQKEDGKPEFALKKRPGLSATDYSLTKSINSDQVRGFYYDYKQNAFYWSVNNKVYCVLPDVSSSVRTVTTLTTSSGYVGFCSYLKSDNTVYVVITDGQTLWLDTGSVVTQVVDADLPVPHVPCPIYLDGYIFLAKANTSDIYNCDVDVPTSWTPGNFISSEMSSDYCVKLAKSKNYLVALGTSTLEYFWDAGNASGSPLTRNESPFRNVGYLTGFAQTADKIFFVGQDLNSNVAVYLLEEFSVKKVSNSIVDRTLQTATTIENIKSNVYLNRDGCIISVDGHTFYVLVTPTTTWVYDIDEKHWYEWRDSAGNGLDIQAAWSMYSGEQFVAIGNQSNISFLDQGIYQDFGTNFSCSYTTEDIDADTVNTKFCYRFTLLSDKYNNTGSSNCDISWSDDDWASTQGPRQVNIFDDLACIRQLGRFRTRSFRISYTDNYPIRITSFEIDLTVGSS
jgi:hypothetical protein